MMGDSSVLGSSGGALAAAPADQMTAEVAGHVIGSNSGEDDKGGVEDGDRSIGVNRWPRQETVALLKIRSDMDAAFRDSSHKGPLWEEISRKMAELGYNRSGKKCKEKFENVYKYHRRTKDGRTGKPDGKTYRFFDQLEAFENVHNSLPSSSSPPKPQTPSQTNSSTMPWTNNSHVFPSMVINPTQNFPSNQTVVSIPQPTIVTNPMNPYPITTINPSSGLFSTSTSSSTASDDDEEGSEEGNGSKKRKWKVFFRRLTKKVIKKQEGLQKEFLETIERRENERVAREEAWRIQEMARIDREHEILMQEISATAAKDTAVVAFLQKISGPNQPPQPSNIPVQLLKVQPQLENPPPPPQPPPPPVQQPPPAAPSLLPLQPPVLNFEAPKIAGNGENYTNTLGPSPSRWPKAEVEALIHLRTNLENKYQENGPKAPLWEEISASMRRLGYNRNAKRCKEKWENINKYFKKVKESNKKRPQDSKTCPYFDQLDAIYREKSKTTTAFSPPLMVQPEQQWPPEEEEDGESDEEDNGFEIVASKAAQVGAGE